MLVAGVYTLCPKYFAFDTNKEAPISVAQIVRQVTDCHCVRGLVDVRGPTSRDRDSRADAQETRHPQIVPKLRWQRGGDEHVHVMIDV